MSSSKLDETIQSEETLTKLNKLATTKLAGLVDSMAKDSETWRGNENELIAAKELLDRDDENGADKS